MFGTFEETILITDYRFSENGVADRNLTSLFKTKGLGDKRELTFLERKFAKRPEIAETNKRAFQAGYAFGETTDRYVVAVRDTLRDAISRGGSTLRDYVDSNGRPGNYQLDHYVYGRGGQPCRVCGARIRQIRQGGRATTYCPKCQR